jgi:hypothetical protein
VATALPGGDRFKIYGSKYFYSQRNGSCIRILLQKINAAEEMVKALRTAISLFGGHGLIEDFTTLPRLLRDAMLNEL